MQNDQLAISIENQETQLIEVFIPVKALRHTVFTAKVGI